MNEMLRPERLLATAVLAAACAAASAQVGLVGPPTYETQVLLDLAPGDRPQYGAYVAEMGWRSDGRTEVSGAIDYAAFVNFAPSEARAIADDFNLKALSHVGGIVQFNPVDVPHLHATALSRNTRYWQAGAVDTPLDFTPFLDGVLNADMGFAELPFQLFAKVTFSLDVVNAAGQPTLHLFRNSAHIDWNNASARWQFTSSSTLPGTDWADSFTTTSTLQPRKTMRSELVYADFLAGAYTAPAGSLFGLQWTLQTEALVEGIAVSASTTADFLHTAGIGFAISAGAPAGATLTEVLTLPSAVPEPGAAALLLAGLVVMAWRRRSTA